MQVESPMMRNVLPQPLTFWYLRKENTQQWNWKQNQVPLVTVKTEEDFWHFHNYLELASKLDVGCDYSVFRQGIFPDWEDRENMSGGRWIINSEKEDKGGKLDECWQILLTVMLEEHNGLVNGVVVSKRKNRDKMAAWLKDAGQSSEVIRVGRLVKDKLGVEGRIQFNVHKEFTICRRGTSMFV